MDRQEAFDKIVAHLRHQKMRSIGPDGYCLYRGPNNTKCAVGALIEDCDYDPDMEGNNIACLILRFPQLEKFRDIAPLLNKFQLVHDKFNISTWESQFEVIAEMFYLHYIPPNKQM